MRFTEGMWRLPEGIKIDWMGHVERVVEIKHNQAKLLLTRPQRNRGDVLNTPAFTTTLSSPADGILAAKFQHWTGEEDSGPHFELFPQESAKLVVDHKKGQSLRLSSDDLALDVLTSSNNLTFAYTRTGADGKSTKRLTGHSFRSIGLVSDSNDPVYKVSDGLYAQRQHYMLLELDLSVNEKIYGLGERFGPFVKNGQEVEIWQEDGGTSSNLGYKNVPFYMSSRGYGVFINHPGKVMLEIQSERTTRVNIAVQGEELEYMIVAGNSPKDVLNRYTALTGRPSIPPAWSYGLWLTTSFTTSYDEETVTGFLDGFKQRDIPLTTFHFDSFWMKSFQWCDFQFDDENFADAAGYLKRLKDRGMKLCVWMNPYIAQASPLFDEGKKNGYLVMRADTPRPTVWQTDNWVAGMGLVDFTNPEACKWYASFLKKLMAMGIDAFKTDFGERIPFRPTQVKYHDNSDTIRMHNYYTFLYNKTVFEAMQSVGKDACLFARSATAGSQRFPVHWGGDCESTFEAMAETLRGGLSLALSGFAFWAHDIGGFEGRPPPALYKRWVQFGLLSSHSRLHGSGSYRVPWIYEEDGEDEKCSKVLRECVKLKLSLMPYLLRIALEAKTHGVPLMRAMFLEFPNDLNAYQLDTQYMLGPNLLVAPVFSANGEVSFYVPLAGNNHGSKWRSWYDHAKTYEEGRWYTETYDFDSLPLLVRPGTVTAFNNRMETPDQDFGDGLEILLNGPLDVDTTVELVNASAVEEVAKTMSISKDGIIRGSNAQVRNMA